jgi:hypothetical protein
MSNVQPTDFDLAAALAGLFAMPDTVQNPRRRTSASRGPKTTIVHFRGQKEIHRTARDAYIAQSEHLIALNPDPLNDQRVTKGSARNYFAKNKDDLFLKSPHLLDNRDHWVRLKNGWYAITNLSATENFKILCRFANACGLRFGKDWDFEPLDPTQETSNARRREQINQEMMDEAFKYPLE